MTLYNISLRDLVKKVGRMNLVIIVTLVTIVTAEFFVYFINNAFNFYYAIPDVPLVTGLVTLIITPLVSWALIGLLFELEAMEEKMNKLATYDSLTGLLLRQPFMDKLTQVHEKFIKEKTNYSILIVDMDDFKIINDTYGHLLGDEVLIEYSSLVKNIFNNHNDFSCRLGGEEFVTLTQLDLTNVLELANKLCKEYNKLPIYKNNIKIKKTISIGICENTPEKNYSTKKVLEQADSALYNVKSNGKNGVSIFK